MATDILLRIRCPRLQSVRALERHSAVVDTIMTIPAKRQKIPLGIISPLGPELDVMNLQVPMAAAELAGKLIPPEDIDHDFFPAPGPPHRVGMLAIPAISHAELCICCSSPMPAR